MLEADAQIEDFAVVNNGAGDVRIGEGSRVGVGSVVVGPVDIGRYVFLGQHVSIQGLIHGYEDVTQDPNLQPLMLRPVKVGDYTHLGTNSNNHGRQSPSGETPADRRRVGRHQGHTALHVADGNPARVVKRYDFEKKEWVRV